MTSVTAAEGEVTTSVSRFVEVDEEGALYESGGREIRVRWTDLQAHASFPADVTTIIEETITTKLGTFDCWRYSVASVETTHRFWFARDLPGMPIKQETVAGGLITATTTVVSDSTLT